MVLAAGGTLSHYRLVERIGEGGMGAVWRALDMRLDREVAIKILPEAFARERERLARFRREARAIAALNHPNIVTIHEVAEAEGLHFFVMELIDGQPLEQRIGPAGLEIQRFLELAVPLADALAAAHRRGITHRDLKPGNIMVTAAGRPKILDFGLARLRHETLEGPASQLPTESLTLTRHGQILGTLPYMSPEQLEGLPVDARSDLFSFGVVLYEMATGVAPFRGESAVVLSNAILKHRPATVDGLKPEFPEDLGRIIGHCLRKDPERRYQTATELRNELEELRVRELAKRVPAGAARRARAFRIVAAAASALALVAVLLAVWPGWLRQRLPPTGRGAAIHSLAVLPLENLSGDPEQDYFADGMTEALIIDLGKVRALERVIARPSVMRYKGSSKSTAEIARELDVQALLVGSVLAADGRVRITAQLIDAAHDRPLWSEGYERELRDVLALQGEVARAVAGQVQAALTPEERTRLGATRPVDPKVHELYLRGRYHWNRRNREGLWKSVDYFREAVELDPNYAAAHAGLADAFAMLGGYAYLRPDEAFPQAEGAARRALELDATLADAHASLAWARLNFGWHWSDAERGLLRAIELNASHATAYHWLALCQAWTSRTDEALATIERARRLDPLSHIINTNRGWILYFARRHDEAIAQLRRTLELDPDFVSAHWKLGFALAAAGEHEEALASMRAVADLLGESVTSELAYATARAGQRDDARRMLAQLLAELPEDYEAPSAIAMVHIGLGDADAALEWLERAAAERDFALVRLGVDPLFDPLRSDSRFDELLRRVGFPPRAAWPADEVAAHGEHVDDAEQGQ